ncbi:hypothetical protein LCGC14_1421470 [marine sediment metagenome]|uniref:Uncharacterized protein n=1 Tax=marine sediment metagenome TaxID=412755 RepID=A0A0F9JR35_9ZZZZ
MQLYRELELWSKDDIVPSDLQTVCRISAIKLKELEAALSASVEREDRLSAELGKEKAEREIEKTVDDEAILGYREENETLHKKLIILRNAKCPKCDFRFKIQKLSNDAD